MVEEVKETIENKILRLKEEFGEAIVVSFSCGDDDLIKLEMAMPRRSWSESDPDDGVDEDGELI